MYLKDLLKKYNNQKIKMFIDMDGVIVDYEVGVPLNFDIKRPLITSISKLQDISKMDNVEMYILSVTRMDKGYEEKNLWLDKHAPFIKKENRIIISRESNNFTTSPELKSNFLKNFKRNESIIILIDDDPAVLHKIQQTSKDIVLLKDTALVD